MSARSIAWRAYVESSAMLTAELDRRMKVASGMDLGDFNVLLVLSEQPGLRLGDLARALAFGPNRLTYRLKTLIERGWVRRQPCPDDGRGFIAVLTPAGSAALHDARPVHARDVDELLLSHVTDEQAAVMDEVFGPLLARMHSL